MKSRVQRTGNVGAASSWVISKADLLHMWRRKRSSQKGGSVTKCQENIDSEIDGGASWLQLSRVLQNLQGKGIATMLGRIDSERVVVKAQSKEAAVRETFVQSQLANIDGFVRFHCMFECAGDKDYISSYGTVDELRRQRVCAAKGDSMGVIVMPFYEGGSLETMLTSPGHKDTAVLKSIITKVIQTLYEAYNRVGFTHGDVFTKNVVVGSHGPVIIDFELSQFRAPNMPTRFWRDIEGFLGDVGRYWNQTRMDDISRAIYVHLAYNVPPDDTRIADLLSAVQAI